MKQWTAGLEKWVKVNSLFECQVTESLFCALRRRQGERKIYFPNRNNFGMKGGTIHICARLIVITWCRPGQTGTFGDCSNWDALQRACLGGDYPMTSFQGTGLQGERGSGEGEGGQV